MVAASSTPHDSPTGSASRRPLLAWPWLFAALAAFATASAFAWLQEPGPAPLNRAKPEWRFLSPIETNPHRRLPAVLDDLHAVHAAPDGLHVWIAGDHGRILATDDGGRHWRAQESGTTDTLTVVTFRKDGLRGWAGDELKARLSTTDGGAHWRPGGAAWEALRTSGALDTPLVLPKPGQADAMASGDQVLGLTLAPALKSGSMQDWAVGQHGTIVATEDGGKSWYPQTSTSQPELRDLWVDAQGMRGWAVGDGGTILATTDRGVTWRRQFGPLAADLLAIACLPDALHCWAGGRNGVLIASSDGGYTWTRQTSTSHQAITGLHFFNDKSGWATDEGGYKLTTEDGGATWRAAGHEPEESGPLRSIVFPSDDKYGWAVAVPRLTAVPDVRPGQPAADGAIRGTITTSGLRRLVRSEDGGRSWHAVARPEVINPLSISFDKDGMHGLVVDRVNLVSPFLRDVIQPGVLNVTQDGSEWQRRKLDDALPLEAAALAADGRHGFAIGKGGQIYATGDGGQNWRHAEPYARYPGLWYWLVVAFSAWLVWQAWRLRPKVVDGESVANVLAPDAAVLRPADDRLYFNGLARGISRFLRNTETQPPLTLAITGDWGSGKSSLMQLVCNDLRRFGHRPIWFNAWHHQKEEHLFASLLGAIYAQAAPPLFSADGLSFRLRLLWVRSRRHFVVMMLAIALISALSLISVSAWRAGGSANFAATMKAVGNPKALAAVAFPGLLAALTTLLSLAKATKTFKANPAVLLKSAKQHMSLKAADAQNNFRAVFARQFDELTSALPYRLVIVVDDLDRCAPSAVIDIMEAVNYLTSSGTCFVIFGMATERVTAALGLAFKDIAAEMVQLENPGPDTPVAEREMAKRRAYATDYLQKLVNIEIKVPTGDQQEQHRLLHQSSPEPQRRMKGFVRELATFWPLALACLAELSGMWLGDAGGDLAAQLAATPPAATSATSAVQSPAPATPPPAAAPPAAPGPTARISELSGEDRAYHIQAGETAGAAQASAWVLLALLPIVVVAIVIGALLWRRTLVRTRDSQNFQDALAIWTPLVAARRNTPRAIKRFGNRLRYLAMLQQGGQHEKTIVDVVRGVLRLPARRKPEADEPAVRGLKRLPEHQLIALGALLELYGAEWREVLDDTFFAHWRQLDVDQFPTEVQALVAAAHTHREKFDGAWPPSEGEMKTFERLMAGIRLPEESEPERPAPDQAPDTPPPPRFSESKTARPESMAR